MKNKCLNKKNQQTVAVLFGGKSVEHDISIITGTQLANALNKEKYKVLPIYISKENEWFFSEKFFEISHFCQKDPLKNAKRVCFLPRGERDVGDRRLRKRDFLRGERVSRGEGLDGESLGEGCMRCENLRGGGTKGEGLGGESLREGGMRSENSRWSGARGKSLGDEGSGGGGSERVFRVKDLRGESLRGGGIRDKSLGGEDLRGKGLLEVGARGKSLREGGMRSENSRWSGARGKSLNEDGMRGEGLSEGGTKGKGLGSKDLRGKGLLEVGARGEALHDDGTRGEGLGGMRDNSLGDEGLGDKSLSWGGTKGESLGGESSGAKSLSGRELFFERNRKWRVFERCDFVFVAMHGNHGENGGVQGLLEMCGVPYSSPNVFGSAVCMSKLATKFVCQSLGINVVKHKIFFESDFCDKMPLKKMLKGFRFPLIVKPNNLGSSIGISFCEKFSKLKDALSFAFLFDGEVLVEEAVQNLRELNLGVLGNRFSCELSQIEEVCVEKNFLTFENKYLEKRTPTSPAASRIIPAKIDKAAQKKIREFGEKIFLSLGLKGVVRIDFLMDGKSGEIFLNEVNSIPGSFACYLFKNKYNYEKLLQKVMDYATEEWECGKKKVVKFSSSVIEKFSENHPFVAKTQGGKTF